MLIRITSAAQTNLPLSVNNKPHITLPVGPVIDLSSIDAYEAAEIIGILDDSHATYEIVDAPAASAGDGADGGVEPPSPTAQPKAKSRRKAPPKAPEAAPSPAAEPEA